MDDEVSVLAQELAKRIENFTITNIEKGRAFGLQQAGINLVDFPPEVLCNIFSFVGKNASNPPPDDFLKYLSVKNERQYEEITSKPRARLMERREMTWADKMKREYAVRNLMMLRGVCTKFEDVINNLMIPGVHFDVLMVDVKIQNRENEVVFFKYGGNGSQYPCTRLRRIQRFNETEFEHIQKFERIRNLHLCDMILTEELFRTIRRLDLTRAEKIRFERIIGVNLNDSMTIPGHIQKFLEDLNSPANVVFNSNEFDPNVVLFGEQRGVERLEHVEEEWNNIGIDEAMFGVRGRENEEVMLMRREIWDVESGEKRHKKIRKSHQHHKINMDVKKFRGQRPINIVHNLLHSKKHSPIVGSEVFPYHTTLGQKKFKRQLEQQFRMKTMNQRAELKAAGEWHMKKIFREMATQPIRGRRSLLDHMKIIKMIVNEKTPLSEQEELSIINQFKETKQREELMKQFPFLEKFHLKSRLYTATVDMQ
uniref:F-box domain-containing protein n=1 Tax=Caenorhabditis tropicalis TaxID=1561998 RepID=A0A1I7U325_9PELO